MLPTPTILIIGIVGLVVAVVIVYVATQSVISVFVVFTLIVILGVVLQRMGVLNVARTSSGVDVSFFEKAPTPNEHPRSPSIPSSPLESKEVFFVSGNDYTYDEAPAVCAAYDSELATYDEVNTAYGKGAEWCGYGWTQGGMALYPTQQSTWEALQQEVDSSKRTSCGRPGINGGYFDATMKFGVNCYGVKPHGTVKLPLPLPGTNTGDFDKMVEKFKAMIKRMTVSPFNRAEWSEWNMSSKTNGLRS